MDKAGVVVPSAKVYVYNQGTTNLASLFNRSNTSIGNPLTSSASGFFEFAAKNGAYDIQFELSDGSKGLLFGVAFSDVSSITDDVIEIRSDLNATKQTADIAQSTADTAQSTANTAKSAADEAKTDAASAKSTATTAKASADKATSDVSSLKTTVDTHSTDISTMQDTVAEASMDASESRVIAVEAKNASTKNTTDVSSLKTKVDTNTQDIATVKTDVATAKSDASSAKATADKASTDASTALTAANGVKSTADSAKSTADTAKSTADAASASISTVTSAVNGVANVTALRARQPAFDGERVYMNCHTPPASAVYRSEGGGWFTGTKTSSQADDGGYNIKAGTGIWTRDKAIEDLTIADFGGVADNTTDASPAFKANLDFISSTYAKARVGNTLPYLSIKFNAGYYYMTPGDYRKYGAKLWTGAPDEPYYPSGYSAAAGISIMGAEVEYGREILTWIRSDKSDLPVFQINHRRQSVSYIGFDGQQTTGYDQYNKDTNPTGTNMLIGATFGIWNDTASNKQQFMTNECAGGLYLKLSCCQYKDIGGDMFFVKDTLDTVIEYCFGSKNAAPFFTTSWSNRVAGAWDHSTSVEIRNCNFGTPLSPVIRAPRCGQSLMWNVWAEHGTTPFDINNGQWDMTMVCLEDNRGEMCLWNSKHSIRTLSVPTGNFKSIDGPTSGKYQGYLKNPDGSDLSAWAEGYGQGSYLLMNYGAYFDCPVISKYDRGYLRGENNTDNTLWVNVGSFTNPTNGGTWKVRILGGSYYNTAAAQNMTSDRLLGETVIYMGRGSASTPKISFYNINGGAVAQAPQYQAQSYNTTIPALWVPIRSRTGEYTIFVEATGLYRGETGQPAQWNVNGNTITTNPGQVAIPGRFSMNTNKAGFGANEDVVEITTRTQTAAAAPVDTTYPIYKRVAMGGVEVAMTVYPYIPQWTTKAPATLSVAAGGTLTISPVVTEAVSYQWQKSTDGGTTWASIANAKSMTYTKTGVTADDAGTYRLAARQTNGMGGDGTTVFAADVTTVTIT